MYNIALLCSLNLWIWSYALHFSSLSTWYVKPNYRQPVHWRETLSGDITKSLWEIFRQVINVITSRIFFFQKKKKDIVSCICGKKYIIVFIVSYLYKIALLYSLNKDFITHLSKFLFSLNKNEYERKNVSQHQYRH